MKKKSLLQHKKDIIKICNLLNQKELIAATDGNVSIKIDSNIFLTTPSGLNKLFITINDLVLINKEGQSLEGRQKPSSEIFMHLEIYKIRKEINSVIHAHPPYITSFSVAGIKLPTNVLPEMVVSVGNVPTAPYATPSTIEVPKSITKLARKHNAIILEKHGAVTYGEDIYSAYNYMEKIEQYAKILFNSKMLGKIYKLSNSHLKKLKSK